MQLHISVSQHSECGNFYSLITNEYILSGRIGMVVASHAVVARSIPAEVALIYTMHEALMGCCT